MFKSAMYIFSTMTDRSARYLRGKTVLKRYVHPCLLTLFFLLLCRILAMYFIPLNDSTEARYAEIARKMLETGNRVTPLHDYGVPFWAKPPLSTWVAAFSMKLFGINEWAVRLPSLFFSFGILGLIWLLAKKRQGDIFAWNAVFVLSLSLSFMINAGAVMTDAALLFSATLVMVAFWLAVMEGERSWRYIFFIGVGLGLLAKGPIILVLTGIPIFVWMLMKREWKNVWLKLPWFSGTLLVIAIALPWYLLAEHRTPGFLQYFILGEHLGRFLQPGWTGDKYGYAHRAPYGMIWVYGLFGLFPWTFLAPLWFKPKKWQMHLFLQKYLGFSKFFNVGLGARLEKEKKYVKDDNVIITTLPLAESWRLYLIFFILTPFIFFSFARNIIYPYILPSVPAFALYFAGLIHSHDFSQTFRRAVVRFGIAFGIIILVIINLFLFCPSLVMCSQKPVVEVWQHQNPSPTSLLVYWARHPNFSAQFYAHGRVVATTDPDVLSRLLQEKTENYLVMRSDPQGFLPTIPNVLWQHLLKVGSVSVHKEHYILYR